MIRTIKRKRKKEREKGKKKKPLIKRERMRREKKKADSHGRLEILQTYSNSKQSSKGEGNNQSTKIKRKKKEWKIWSFLLSSSFVFTLLLSLIHDGFCLCRFLHRCEWVFFSNITQKITIKKCEIGTANVKKEVQANKNSRWNFLEA